MGLTTQPVDRLDAGQRAKPVPRRPGGSLHVSGRTDESEAFDVPPPGKGMPLICSTRNSWRDGVVCLCFAATAPFAIADGATPGGGLLAASSEVQSAQSSRPTDGHGDGESPLVAPLVPLGAPPPAQPLVLEEGASAINSGALSQAILWGIAVLSAMAACVLGVARLHRRPEMRRPGAGSRERK